MQKNPCVIHLFILAKTDTTNERITDAVSLELRKMATKLE